VNPDWRDAPINLGWIRAGFPVAMVLPIANDGCVSAGYWSCTQGEFVWHYDVDETIVFLSGRAMIDGRIVTAGGTRKFCRGTCAHWVVLEPVTKMFVISKPKSRMRRVLGRLKRVFRG
jgi:uncharacterized protein